MSTASERTDLSNMLLELGEVFAPILDYADGMKADLERRGWSPTASEQAAATWLVGAIQQAFRGQS